MPDITDAFVAMVGEASVRSPNVGIRAYAQVLYDALWRAQDEFGSHCGALLDIENQVAPQFQEFQGACHSANFG